jgi:protein-disulfide isomerase
VRVEKVWRHVEGLGLDMARLRQDMGSPEIARDMAQDLADARSLGVTKTPEYFVNGKPLPSFGYEPLKDLVDEALASAYPK